MLLRLPRNVSLRFFGGMSRIAFCSANTALRPLERIEAQAPVDHLEQVVRILARPDLLRRHEVVLLHARVGRLRRERGEAREHRRADAVDVGPRARAGRARGIARARRSRACTSARASAASLVSVCRAAPKSSSTGRAVGAQVDVGRLDVEVQELVRVHFAQAVQQVHEHVPHEAARTSGPGASGSAAAACGRARSASPCTPSRWRGRSSARARRSGG